MHPRIDSTLSAIRHTYAKTRARAAQSSRLTLGAAAAAAVVAAGVAVSVSAGPAPASSASAINRAAAAGATHHARVDVAAKPASSSRPAPAQHSPAHTPAAHTPAAHTPAKSATKQAPKPAAKPAHAAKAAAKPAHKAPAKHAAHRHAARKPYLIYDSVTPSALPHHNVNAVYATGNYAASQAQVAGRHVMWIDTTGSDHAASILDVEPGDATPSMAASWARQRLAANPRVLARIYTMRSEWSAAKAAINTLPAKMRSHVRWWIADPTGHAHVVPGSDATQWYWGSSYDISTATPRF